MIDAEDRSTVAWATTPGAAGRPRRVVSVDHLRVGHAVAPRGSEDQHGRDDRNPAPRIVRDEMNAYFTQELTRQHQAELLREAENARLARIARYGGEVNFGGPVKRDGRVRLVAAL